jgi:hypothetical protein
MSLYLPGTADPADVLAGKRFSSKSKYNEPGTMVNNGAGGTVTPSASAQTKPAGYYSSAITVAAVPVPAANVLSGTTIAGTAGTMPDNRGVAKDAVGTTLYADGNLFLNTPEGYYNPTSSIRSYEANLANTANWRADRAIFGRAGTLPIISAADDVAQGVAIWPNRDLAVYPREGYRKGGAGAGEIKVTSAQMQSVEGNLRSHNIRNGVNIFGVVGSMIEGKRTDFGWIRVDNYGVQSGWVVLAWRPRIIVILKANNESPYTTAVLIEDYGVNFSTYFNPPILNAIVRDAGNGFAIAGNAMGPGDYRYFASE